MFLLNFRTCILCYGVSLLRASRSFHFSDDHGRQACWLWACNDCTRRRGDRRRPHLRGAHQRRAYNRRIICDKFATSSQRHNLTLMPVNAIMAFTARSHSLFSWRHRPSLGTCAKQFDKLTPSSAGSGLSHLAESSR
jgi:hypothetical protein